MIENYDEILKERSVATKPYYFVLWGNFTIPANGLPMPQIMSSIGVIGQDNTGPGPIENISVHEFKAMPNETLILYSVTTLTVQPVDGYLGFTVDNIDQSVNYGPVNILLPSNYHHGFSFKPVEAEPNSSIKPIFRMYQPGLANSTATVSVQFYFVSVPVFYDGPVIIPNSEDE